MAGKRSSGKVNKKKREKTEKACPVTLGDELTSVKLGNYGLEDLIDDRGEDTLIEILAKGAENVGELVDIRPGEDTQGDVHHLKIWQQRSGKEEAHARTHNQQLEMGGERTRRGEGAGKPLLPVREGMFLGFALTS